MDTSETRETPYLARRARINDLDLHYTDWPSVDAESNRPPVLLLHGLGSFGHAWDPMARVLCQRRRVLSLDLRGHGRSSWATSYRLADFAADVAALMAERGLESVDIVGHSLGARVGLTLAGSSPQLVRRLVMSDSGIQYSPEGVALGHNMFEDSRTLRSFADEAQALRYFQQVSPGWEPEFYGIYVEHMLRRNWVDKLVFRSDPEAYWMAEYTGLPDPAFWELAAKATAPTLVIRATESPVFDDESLDKLIAGLADAQLVNLPGTHSYLREHPTEFVAEVLRFLD